MNIRDLAGDGRQYFFDLKSPEAFTDDAEQIRSIVKGDIENKFEALKEYAVELRKLVADDYVLVNVIQGPKRNIKLTPEQLASIETIKIMRVEFLEDILSILLGADRETFVNVR